MHASCDFVQRKGGLRRESAEASAWYGLERCSIEIGFVRVAAAYSNIAKDRTRERVDISAAGRARRIVAEIKRMLTVLVQKLNAETLS